MSPPTATKRFDRLLRWYPATWRSRYGDQLLAFMEDSYGDGDVPARVRFDMARGALAEHGAEMGLVVGQRSTAGRLRGGALLVLCAWAFFVIGGSVFAKASEGWAVARPTFTHGLARAGFESVLWAGVAGALVIILAAATALPCFVRYLGADGWSEIRRPILGAVVITIVTTAAGSAVVLWAHHLVFAQRNGGYWPYSMAFLILAALVVATVAGWTVAALRTVAHLELPSSVLYAEGGFALILTVLMTVILTGTVAWSAMVATDAPRFLSGAMTGPPGSPLTPNLLTAGAFMAAGLGLAFRGAGRVTGALRTDLGH
jgi:hypothetical protein